MVPLDELEQQEAREEFTIRELANLGQDRASAYLQSVQQAKKIAQEIPPDEDSHFFTVGDMVKMKHHAKSKFEYSWKGPYHIVALGHPGTYFLIKPDGQRLDSTVNQRDLAPWLATTKDNEEYAYMGSSKRKEGVVLDQ